MNSFYSRDELELLKFKSLGKNVLLSRNACIYSPEKMVIGSHVRIDDFCILSGHIEIGSYIHISAYSAIYGSMGVIIEDYSGLSPRSTIFSAMDDFSGEYLINPMVNSDLRNVKGGLVHLQKYVQIGAGSIVFPKLTIATGSVVGAMSLVNNSTNDWGIYVGIPAKRIKERSRDLLNLLSHATSSQNIEF